MKVIYKKLLFSLTNFYLYFNLYAMDKESIQNINFPHFSPYTQISEYEDNAKWMQLITILKEKNIKGLILSFIQDSHNCNPAWDGDKNNVINRKEFNDKINILENENILYKISFGGIDGFNLALECITENDLFNAYFKVYTLYKPTGFDFDLEGNILNNPAAIEKILKAIVIMQNKFPKILISFTFPVKISGLERKTKDIIKKAKMLKIEFSVNLMTMNFSPEETGNMTKYIQSSAYNTFKLLSAIYPRKNKVDIWKQIEITPMIGLNDIKGEVFTLDNAKKLKGFENLVSLGALHFWSLERDKPCNLKKVSPTCSGISKQKNYEFSEIFQGK
ncbi:hypothetical protein [Silvanigrella aquatica]|uniref:GH18 domain-containing protein n=1 Tax=Silvanigrella aquatica TaxID=1915309 RepID=A0A1L4CX97_9BACT|nr:hypothetical protein [Silvanigrella aquatica]APJ02572.1 hypothetical protein AXG55_00935 [Silvanigrella aquatica]